MEEGKVSLVDYGWATDHSRLDVSCTVNGIDFKSGAKRPHNEELDLGFATTEKSSDVGKRLPRTCVA